MKEHVSIVRISIEGVKAFDRDLVIGPRTALVGPPASGKSSFSDGLRFAALGHVPHLGGREADTAKILRGDRMVVHVELSDGRRFSRSLGRDGSALRMEARTSWLPPGATATAQSAAIRSLFGDSDEEAAECLDLRELLEASPSARAARIEALLSATSMKATDLAALLGALLVTRLAKMPEAGIPDDREARGALIHGLTVGLPKAVAAALVPVLRDAATTIQAGGVPALLAFANEGKKRATQEVGRKLSARAELEDRSRGLRAPATTLDTLNIRRGEVADRLAVLRSQLSQALAMGEARKAAEARLKAAEALAVDHAKVRETIAETRATAARWTKEAEEAVANLPALPPAPVLVETDPKVAKKAAADEAKAKSLEDAAAKVLAVPAPTAPGMLVPRQPHAEDRAIADAERAIEVAKADPWGKVARIAEHLGLVGVPDAGRADVVELAALAGEHAPDLVALENALAAARSEKVAFLAAAGMADEENAKAQAAHESAVAAWKKARAAAETHRKVAADIRKDARDATQAELARVAEANRGALEAHAAATAEAMAARKAAEAKRATLLRQAASAIEAADGDAADLAAEEAEVEASRAHLAGQSDALPIDAAGAKEEVATLDVELAAIDESKREVEGADARKREVDELVAEIQRAEAERDVFVAAEWAAQRLRERDLAARGGPILDRMRTFLKAAGRTEEPYIRATKSATDFGWRRAGAELPVEALSGAETVLFTTALAVAIVDLRAPTVRCILLEAADFGAQGPTEQVLRGLEGCASMIDTALLATSVPVVPGKAWTVHALAPAPAAK